MNLIGKAISQEHRVAVGVQLCDHSILLTKSSQIYEYIIIPENQYFSGIVCMYLNCFTIKTSNVTKTDFTYLSSVSTVTAICPGNTSFTRIQKLVNAVKFLAASWSGPSKQIDDD